MSSIGKSEKFRQNEEFKCLLQPRMEEVFRKEFRLKGNWKSSIFHNNNPLTLELGCGKGEYTIALAEKYPDRNFIGIDIKGARLWKGAKYVESNGLKNVVFIRTSIDFIEGLFAENEISEIWITFADPQLKNPRKRLTGILFLSRYSKFLVADGIIHLKTDSRYLHEYSKALAEQNGCRVLCCSTDIYNGETVAEKVADKVDANVAAVNEFPEELLTVQTFYEKFYLSLGLPITYLSFTLPPKLSDYQEPVWDEAFWKAEEDKGRTRKQIR